MYLFEMLMHDVASDDHAADNKNIRIYLMVKKAKLLVKHLQLEHMCPR